MRKRTIFPDEVGELSKNVQLKLLWTPGNKIFEYILASPPSAAEADIFLPGGSFPAILLTLNLHKGNPIWMGDI